MRRAVVATMAGVSVSMALTPGASAYPVSPDPPFIDHVEWAKWRGLSSLRVYPTAAGRLAAGQLGTHAEADEAWAEALMLAPGADMPGMRAQFVCHWKFAEFAQPGKASWNLEPWRPVVDDKEMLATGCNPGGTEGPF